MFVALGDKRTLTTEGEMWSGERLSCSISHHPSGVGAVLSRLLRTLNPSGFGTR